MSKEFEKALVEQILIDTHDGICALFHTCPHCPVYRMINIEGFHCKKELQAIAREWAEGVNNDE
jgi:hypothetical protein